MADIKDFMTLQDKIALAENRTLRWARGFEVDFPDDGRWKILPRLPKIEMGYVKEIDYKCKYCGEVFGGIYTTNKIVCFNCRKKNAEIRRQKRKKRGRKG